MLARLSFCALLSLLAVAALGPSSQAQIPVDYPAVGVTRPGTCDGAPDVWSAPAQSSELGVFDVWIYPFMGAEEVRAIALGAIGPVDWLEEPVLEVCHGTLLSGGIVSMWPIGWALSITLDLTGEPTYRPAIRLRINATSPGRLSLDPLGGGFAYQRMDGSWVDYFGAGDETYAYVEIGERCGWEPLGTAGNFCELFVGHAHAGEVDGLTRVLTLTEGATHADTVLASGPEECPRGIPECGQPAPGSPCYGGLRTDVPWIALELLEILGPATERYRVVIDAAGLSQGTYIGNVIASGACTYCRDVCRWIRLTVVPVAIEPTSWGRIKAAYRE